MRTPEQIVEFIAHVRDRFLRPHVVDRPKEVEARAENQCSAVGDEIGGDQDAPLREQISVLVAREDVVRASTDGSKSETLDREVVEDSAKGAGDEDIARALENRFTRTGLDPEFVGGALEAIRVDLGRDHASSRGTQRFCDVPTDPAEPLHGIAETAEIRGFTRGLLQPRGDGFERGQHPVCRRAPEISRSTSPRNGDEAGRFGQILEFTLAGADIRACVPAAAQAFDVATEQAICGRHVEIRAIEKHAFASSAWNRCERALVAHRTTEAQNIAQCLLQRRVGIAANPAEGRARRAVVDRDNREEAEIGVPQELDLLVLALTQSVEDGRGHGLGSPQSSHRLLSGGRRLETKEADSQERDGISSDRRKTVRDSSSREDIQHITEHMTPTPRTRGALFAIVASLAFLGLGACSSVDSAGGKTKDPAFEEEAKARAAERNAQLARDRDFDLVLLRIDKALDEYATNASKSENQKAQRRAESLRKYLEVQSRRFGSNLVGALGSDAMRQRSIASAALGFSGDESYVEALVNALDDEELIVRSNSALGLGQLAAASTPVERLAEIASDVDADIRERRAAAWALFRIQTAVRPKGFIPQDKGPFRKVWPAILAGETLNKDGILTVQALRGLGLLRSPSTLASASPYLSHPKALIRQAALVAVARSRNRRGAPMVLPFLSPSETNPNVRLTARKALKALTGDRVDHEYDTKLWRREFEDVLGEDQQPGAGTKKG